MATSKTKTKRKPMKRVAVGDMVYLTNGREGMVRFKGKTGFGLGEWYGIELRTEQKSRHDGMVHNKRYFRTPRNKGLFVRKQIIVDVMDKKTAEQKTRVFKMGGMRRYRKKNIKKVSRKYTKKKNPKNKAKVKETPPVTDTKKLKKQHKKSTSIVENAGDDTKYIKLAHFNSGNNETETEAEIETQTDNENENEDIDRDKESFSNPKARKYFGKDQIFTTLDRRRSKMEDNFTPGIDTETQTKYNKRRNSKKKAKVLKKKGKTNMEMIKISEEMTELKEEMPEIKEEKQVSDVKDEQGKAVIPPRKSKKYRPFGGDASPKVLSAPLHIKAISMEFTRGNLKAKLKTVKYKKKKVKTIRNVYEKYSSKADYPKLDDLRNETLVSEFLSFDLYNGYREERDIVEDYSIDRCIECGCFYLPDPIGFRLADLHSYSLFQELCDELLSVLHDEWNPKDSPHRKNIDWRQLIDTKALNKPAKAIKAKKRRSRGISSLREKRKRSKRRKNTSIATTIEISEECEISEEKDTEQKKQMHMHMRSSLQSSSFLMQPLQLWDNDYVESCRLTLSRNLHGFRFSNVITRNERRNIEQMLSSVLSQCNEGPLKGRYRPYHKINKSKLPLLIETDKVFPKPDAPGLIMAGYTRDWPESRGIFINSNKNLYIWCNYLEHLHLISSQNDGNILSAFKRLFDSEQKLESLIAQRQQICLDNLRAKQESLVEKERLTKQEYRIKKTDLSDLSVGFVFDPELGFITSNPQYFGTSMRVYVTVKLPNLINHPKLSDILEIRNLTAYQHNLHSAQEMFKAYSSQLPSNEQIRQRRNSASNVHTTKIANSETSQTEIKILKEEIDKIVNVAPTNENVQSFKRRSKKRTDDLVLCDLNLPEISNKDNERYNEPKVSLKNINNGNTEGKDSNNINDEELGDVVNPLHYKEEITIYQTQSLGISEVDSVRHMIESINYLIDMEKLLASGSQLDERIKTEKLKKKNTTGI